MTSAKIRLKVAQILTREIENIQDLEDIIYDLSVYYKPNLTIDLNLLKKTSSINIDIIRTILNRMDV